MGPGDRCWWSSAGRLVRYDTQTAGGIKNAVRQPEVKPIWKSPGIFFFTGAHIKKSICINGGFECSPVGISWKPPYESRLFWGWITYSCVNLKMSATSGKKKDHSELWLVGYCIYFSGPRFKSFFSINTTEGLPQMHGLDNNKLLTVLGAKFCARSLIARNLVEEEKPFFSPPLNRCCKRITCLIPFSSLGHPNKSSCWCLFYDSTDVYYITLILCETERGNQCGERASRYVPTRQQSHCEAIIGSAGSCCFTVSIRQWMFWCSSGVVNVSINKCSSRTGRRRQAQI